MFDGRPWPGSEVGISAGTIRTQLINIPARLARSARRRRIHLPEHWPWQTAWQQLFQATLAPS